MTFKTVPEIVKAFCLDQALTAGVQDSLLIVGNLEGRKIRQILTDSGMLGHIIHRIRYCFNLFHYKEYFNDAAEDYIKKATFVLERKPNPPLVVVPPKPAPEPEPVAPPIVDQPAPVPPPPEPEPALPPPPVLNKSTEIFLELVRSELGNRSAELWRILFTHFLRAHSTDLCRDFTLNAKTQILHIDKPLHIHMHPVNEKNEPQLEGGIILTFGLKGIVEMRVERGVIHFKSGVTGLAKVPSGFPFAGRTLEMKISQFQSDTSGVTIKAGTLGFSGGKKESFTSMKETWSHRAHVLPHNADLKAAIATSSSPSPSETRGKSGVK